MPKSVDEFSRRSDSLGTASESSRSSDLHLYSFPRLSGDSDDGASSIRGSSLASSLTSVDPSISKAAAASLTDPAVKSFTESFMDRTKSMLGSAFSYFKAAEEPKAGLSSVITPLSEKSSGVTATSCLLTSNKSLKPEHAQGLLRSQLIKASSILEERMSTLTDDKLKEVIQRDVDLFIPRLGRPSKETVTWMKELLREYCVNGDRETAFAIGQALCVLEPNDPDHWTMQAYLAEGDDKEAYYNEANRLKASPITGSHRGVPQEALPAERLDPPVDWILLKEDRPRPNLIGQTLAPIPNLRPSKPVEEPLRSGPSLKSKPMQQEEGHATRRERDLPGSPSLESVKMSASSDKVMQEPYPPLPHPVLSSIPERSSASSSSEPELSLGARGPRASKAYPSDVMRRPQPPMYSEINHEVEKPLPYLFDIGPFLIFLSSKVNADRVGEYSPNLKLAGHLLDAKLRSLSIKKQSEINSAIKESYRTGTLPKVFKDWMIEVALDFREQNTPESRGSVVIIKTALTSIYERGFSDFLRAYYDRFPISGETFRLFESSEKSIKSALAEPSVSMPPQGALNETPSRNRGKDSSSKFDSLELDTPRSGEFSVGSASESVKSPDESSISNRPQPMSAPSMGASRGPKKRKPELSSEAPLPILPSYRREKPRDKPSEIPSLAAERAISPKQPSDAKIHDVTLLEHLESPPLLPGTGSFLVFLNSRINTGQVDENVRTLEAAGRLLDKKLYALRIEEQGEILQAVQEGYRTGMPPDVFTDWMIEVALDYEEDRTPEGKESGFIIRKALTAIDPQGYSRFLKAYFVRFPINGEVSRSPSLRVAILDWGESVFESRRNEILENIEYERSKEGYIEHGDLEQYETEFSYRKQALLAELDEVGRILEKAILNTDGLEKRADLTKGMLSLLQGEERPEVVAWIRSLAERQPENASALLLFVSLLEDLRGSSLLEDDLGFFGDISGRPEVESSQEISLLEESDLPPHALGDLLSSRLVTWVNWAFEYKVFEIAEVMDIYKDKETLSYRKQELLERFQIVGQKVGDILQRELERTKNIEEKKQICRDMDALMQRGNSLEARKWIEQVAAKNPEHALVIFQFLFFIDPKNSDYEAGSVVEGSLEGRGDELDCQGAIYDALTGKADEVEEEEVAFLVKFELRRGRYAYAREDSAESINDLRGVCRAIDTRWHEIDPTIQVMIKSLIEKASRGERIGWHEVLTCTEALGSEDLLKILDFFDPSALTREAKAWDFFLQQSQESPDGVPALLVSIGKQLLDKDFPITRFLAYGQTEENGRQEMFSRLLVTISIMETELGNLPEKERQNMQKAIEKALLADDPVAKKSVISWMEDVAWRLRSQKNSDVKEATAIFHTLVLLDPEKSNHWSYLGDITKEAAYLDEAARLIGSADVDEIDDEVEEEPIAADVRDPGIQEMERAFASLEDELSSLEKEVGSAENTKSEIIEEPSSHIQDGIAAVAAATIDDLNQLEDGPSLESAIDAFTMSLLSKGRKVIQGGESIHGLSGDLAREYLMENLDMVGVILQGNVENVDPKEREIVRYKIINTFSGSVDKDVIATLMFLAENYEKTWKEGSSALYLALILLDPTNVHRQQWYSQVEHPDLVASLVGRKKMIKEDLLKKVEWKSEDSVEILSERLLDNHQIEIERFLSGNEQITEEEIQEWVIQNLEITGGVLETVLERLGDPTAKNIMQNKMERTLEGTPDPEVLNGLMVVAQEYQERGLQDSARAIYRTLAFLDPSSSNIEEWKSKGKEGLDEAHQAVFEILLKENEEKRAFGEKVIPKSS